MLRGTLINGCIQKRIRWERIRLWDVQPDDVLGGPSDCLSTLKGLKKASAQHKGQFQIRIVDPSRCRDFI